MKMMEKLEACWIFGRCEAPYRQLASSYQQEKYFDHSGFFVGPIEVPIAVGFSHSTIHPLVMLNNLRSI